MELPTGNQRASSFEPYRVCWLCCLSRGLSPCAAGSFPALPPWSWAFLAAAAGARFEAPPGVAPRLMPFLLAPCFSFFPVPRPLSATWVGLGLGLGIGIGIG